MHTSSILKLNLCHKIRKNAKVPGPKVHDQWSSRNLRLDVRRSPLLAHGHGCPSNGQHSRTRRNAAAEFLIVCMIKPDVPGRYQMKGK